MRGQQYRGRWGRWLKGLGDEEGMQEERGFLQMDNDRTCLGGDMDVVPAQCECQVTRVFPCPT